MTVQARTFVWACTEVCLELENYCDTVSSRCLAGTISAWEKESTVLVMTKFTVQLCSLLAEPFLEQGKTFSDHARLDHMLTDTSKLKRIESGKSRCT